MYGAQYSSNASRLCNEKFLFSSCMPAIGSNRQVPLYQKNIIKQHKYQFDIAVINSINPGTMTKFLKKDQLTSSWFEIDAKDAVVGRLAAIVSNIIRGKNKTTYTPHMDDGDFVVVKNIELIRFTGKKFQNKKYYRHTGHPGGIKETTPEKLQEKKPGEALKLAVKRMLPGGVLGKKQLTKLKIYKGSNHPHSAQNPKVIELGKLNTKNIVRN
jgi:large subunit ribosomal protein L13